MPIDDTTLLIAGIFVIGLLYSSVGHAGASGYIAVMSLIGMAPAEIKPTALLLNILVASITSWQFYRSGHFAWSLFWPFAVLAVPFAFLGGYINLPTAWFKMLVGVILLYSAWRFLAKPAEAATTTPPRKPVALATGAGLGLLSGLTGTGGGIFLTPLMLFMRWAPVKRVAAVSSLFILVNSTAGLAGNWSSTQYLPPVSLWLLVAAGIGGALGSHFGSRRFNPAVIKRLLAIVLTIAGAKLLFGG